MNSVSQSADERHASPAGHSIAKRSRVVAGYLALAFPGLMIVADTLAAMARGWRIESLFDRTALIALAALLALATGALVMASGRRFYSRYSSQLILLSVSCCTAWLLAELLLGPVLAAIAEPFHGRRPDTQLVYHPKLGIMRDVGAEASVKFNAWGVRGTDPPAREAAYRILCLGGSSTACTYLDDAKAWPHLLENELQAADSSHGYWVGNAGMPGFRTDLHLQFVETSSLVHQVDCLLIQPGINDFAAALAGDRPAGPLWSQSRLRRLMVTLGRHAATSATAVEDTAGEVYLRRRAVRQAAELDRIEPDLEPSLRKYADNLRAIIATCRRRNVRPVFTSQAVLWRADLDPENASLIWFGLRPDGRYLSIDQLRAGMDRYNAALRAVCEERGVEWIDLSSLDGDPAVFYDDCHFTETGARRVAQSIADWFIAHPAASLAEAAR